MDDVWDSDAQEPGELKKIEREFSNAGFLEGITRSKEETHQGGFDEGYAEGASVGISAGNIIGSLQAMGLKDMETAALKDLTPQKLFSYDYYNPDSKPLFPQGEHPLIVKWQRMVNSLEKKTDE